MLILSLAQDIEFQHDGIDGAICPYSKTDIGLAYGSIDKQYSSVDDLMNDPVFNGESLRTIAAAIKIY